MKHLYFVLLICIFTSCTTSEENTNPQKTLIDFFLPLPNQAPLVSEGTWGAEGVLPRDTANGLEDATLKNWCYWDGSIVKDDAGKYHMYASRWTQELSHSRGWNKGSKGMHSVSDHLFGPYKDLGEAWPNWNNGMGHNVIGLRMHDGRYALVNSEVVPGEVFVSDNPEGPFERLGNFEIDPNGYYPGWGRYNELDDGAMKAGVVGHLSNVMIILRPGGRYMMVARHCVPMISDNGILGPYKMFADKAWLGVKGLPQFKMEDPTVWYSDNMYHIAVNFHGADSTFHLTSADGIHNWKNRGLVYHNSRNVFKHTDGTVENWFTVQRPTVYVEDEEVKAFNFSVIDVHKGKDKANDNHGSKVIVVPFDGKAFRKHINQIVEAENNLSDATPALAPWQSTDIGTVKTKGNTGYDAEVNTIRVKACGNKMDATQDAFRYVYQEVSGDIASQVLVLSHDVSENPVKAGLMIRSSLEDDAPFIYAAIDKETGFTLTKRDKKARKVSIVHKTKMEAPYYLRMVKKDNWVSCYISSSNRLNWKMVGKLKIDLNDTFYMGLASTSNNSLETGFARYKNAEIHTLGKPKQDGIVNHTFPDTISASGIVDFEIEMESIKANDIWVELQNVQTLEKYKVLRKRCWKSGSYKLTYDAGKPLDPNATYWFVIKTVPMHFHDSEHIQSAFKKVFVQ